jgi:hypothetical protein
MANQTQVFDVTISFFGSDLEEVKSAAAFAVGESVITKQVPVVTALQELWPSEI